jgi:hypothetical protein
MQPTAVIVVAVGRVNAALVATGAPRDVSRLGSDH